jgi:hypothetical protein
MSTDDRAHSDVLLSAAGFSTSTPSYCLLCLNDHRLLMDGIFGSSLKIKLLYIPEI